MLEAPLRPPTRTIGTALHVCQIFDCFGPDRDALRLTEITQLVGLQKSSVYRLLQTLVGTGYLAFDRSDRRYRLGASIDRLADVMRAKTSLGEVARPFLERVRDATHETTALQIRDGDARFCLLELPSPQSIRMVLGEKTSYSAKKGASGHVLRAFAADWNEQRDRAHLKRIRDAGYAVSRGELIDGAIAIYVPVFDAHARLVAALGVQAPAFRNPPETVERIVALLAENARELAAHVDPALPLR